MDDRQIRETIVRHLMGTKGCSTEEIASLCEISLEKADVNLAYLSREGYIDPFPVTGSSKQYIRTAYTSAYLANTDTSSSSFLVGDISGGNVYFAGKDMNVDASTVSITTNIQEIPEQYHAEMQELMEVIKEASCPKKEQGSKITAFLEKVSTSSTSSVVASCAMMLIKTALGLPL